MERPKYIPSTSCEPISLLDLNPLCTKSVMGWGCQRAEICSLTMLHVSHPYLLLLCFTGEQSEAT